MASKHPEKKKYWEYFSFRRISSIPIEEGDTLEIYNRTEYQPYVMSVLSKNQRLRKIQNNSLDGDKWLINTWNADTKEST